MWLSELLWAALSCSELLWAAMSCYEVLWAPLSCQKAICCHQSSLAYMSWLLLAKNNKFLLIHLKSSKEHKFFQQKIILDTKTQTNWQILEPFSATTMTTTKTILTVRSAMLALKKGTAKKIVQQIFISLQNSWAPWREETFWSKRNWSIGIKLKEFKKSSFFKVDSVNQKPLWLLSSQKINILFRH